MRFSSRFFLYGPLGVLIALIVAASAVWWMEVSAFEKRLDAMNGHEIAPGISFHYAARHIAGFPFRIDASFDKVQLTIATPSGNASWQGDGFALHMLTYGGEQAVFEAGGNQSIGYSGPDGSQHSFDFLPGSVRGDAIWSGGALQRLDLVVVALASPALRAARIEAHLRKHPGQDVLDAVLAVEALHADPPLGLFGSYVRQAHVTVALSHAAALTPFLSGNKTWSDAVEDWREAGGVLSLARAEIAAEGMSIAATGTLALDSAHRIEGVVNADMSGAEPGKEGKMGVFAAMLSHAVTTGHGNEGNLAARLAVKDGVAYVGNTPAGMVKPLY